MEKKCFPNTNRGFHTTQLEYKQLYARLRHNPYFSYNYGTTLIQAKHFEQGISVLNETSKYFIDTDLLCTLGDGYKGIQQYEIAEKNYFLASNMVPNKFYPLYCLTQLYVETGRHALATNIAKDLINKQPKINSYTVSKIKSEMKELIDSISQNK
jgi:tetratricopeptide (TPR) repeat protein